MLSREEMLQRSRLRVKTFEDCPEWEHVTLRQLPLSKLAKLEVKFPPTGEQMAELILSSVVSETGEPLFAEEDRSQFIDINPKLAMWLWNHIFELNTITDKKVDDEVKN